MKLLAPLFSLFFTAQPTVLDNDTAIERVQKYSEIINAIFEVESGGEANPSVAIGDNGKARGWAQMHKTCYLDCCTVVPTLENGGYEMCASHKGLSAICIIAYAHKYKAKTDTEVALCWHLGPRWVSKTYPHEYMSKIEKTRH